MCQVRLTCARAALPLPDRLLLAESMDSEEDHRQYDAHRKKAKKLLQRLSLDERTQVVHDEPFYFLCGCVGAAPLTR